LSLADSVAEPEHIWGISVRDSLGRHTGMNWTTGDIEREIPGSYYTGHYNKPPSDTPQVLVVYPSDNSLEVVYHALESPEELSCMAHECTISSQIYFNFSITHQSENETIEYRYENVSLAEYTTATINTGAADYTLVIDFYGDGKTLVTKEPDVYVQKLVDF